MFVWVDNWSIPVSFFYFVILTSFFLLLQSHIFPSLAWPVVSSYPSIPHWLKTLLSQMAHTELRAHIHAHTASSLLHCPATAGFSPNAMLDSCPYKQAPGLSVCLSACLPLFCIYSCRCDHSFYFIMPVFVSLLFQSLCLTLLPFIPLRSFCCAP